MRKTAASLFAAAVLGGVGVAVALVISGDAAHKNAFCSEFVPQMEASSQYKNWSKQQASDRNKWLPYRTSICADGQPASPVMSSSFGKAIVVVGEMALTVDEPPITTTTTTPPLAECADGIDNDNDTKIDYLNDPGCGSLIDDDEVDPLSTYNVTTGETSILPYDDSGNGGLLLVQEATLAETGIIRSLSFYVTTAVGTLRLGIYNAAGLNGDPGAKIAETASFTPVVGWNTQPVTTFPSLPAGNYWLAYMPSSSSMHFRNGPGNARWYSTAYGPMPITFSTTSISGPFKWSLYATIEVGGSPPPPPPAAQCADGLDNDADTKIDFPADPGCTSATDIDEIDLPPPPSDGEPIPIAGQGYSKVWGDEFNSVTPDWGGIWWNPTAPANSIFVQNGILNLVSRRSQGYADITLSTESSTSSGRWKQGYFEARMKWTKGAGAWPGFWLMGYAHSQGIDCPPLISELDVFEGQGTEPTTFYGTLHRNTNSGCGVQDQTNDGWHQVPDMTTAFHTYSARWTLTEIKWYLDDVLVGTAPVYDSTDQEMFILLQMWIGGWTSDPNSSTPDELKTEVDWVRVWQK